MKVFQWFIGITRESPLTLANNCGSLDSARQWIKSFHRCISAFPEPGAFTPHTMASLGTTSWVSETEKMLLAGKSLESFSPFTFYALYFDKSSNIKHILVTPSIFQAKLWCKSGSSKFQNLRKTLKDYIGWSECDFSVPERTNTCLPWEAGHQRLTSPKYYV